MYLPHAAWGSTRDDRRPTGVLGGGFWVSLVLVLGLGLFFVLVSFGLI